MKKVIIILYFILMGVISICANEMGNHQEGYWIVLQNRIQDEVWYELNDDYDTGDFTTVLRLSYSEYGHVPDDDNIYYEDNHLPDVPFYFVINGVNYGPLTNNQVTIYGYALANPLAENNNHYIIPSGWCYNVGIATDDAGNMYCYVAVANPAGGSQYDYMFNCYDDGLYYRIEENNNEAVLTYNQDNPYQGGHVIIPESVAWRGSTYPVTAIDGTRWRAWGAFSGCTGLTDITIPNSVTTIGDGAFSGCTGLTDITIPNSVTTIGDGAFSGCTGLTDITIPNSVTFIGWYAFYGCTGLTEIMIPNSVTSIGGYAFSGCTGLTDITIPYSVTTIGDWAFEGCAGLAEITIPDDVIYIGEYAFDGCTGLKTVYYNAENCSTYGRIFPSTLEEIVIGDNVTQIPYSFVSGCTGLQSVLIPNSVTSIGSSAFSGCTGLTSITIPDDVTYIDEYAFEGCTGLTDVSIGSSVRNIEGYAFSGCSSVEIVTCWAMTPPNISYNTFRGTPSTMTVYVLPEALESYQEDYDWNRFNIKPIQGTKLIVNMPVDADISKYADMKLAISSPSSDNTLHYIVTDKTNYSFAVKSNTIWNVTLSNQYGDEFGIIDNVEIGEQDVAVTFASLKQPQTVTLTVKTPAGQDVTEQVSISWSDESGELLKQGKQIIGLPVGRKLAYSVKLPQELATAYSLPADMTYIVKEGSNSVLCQLTAIAQTQLSGKVKEASTNQPIYGASISVTQTFAGGNTKTVTTRTDNQGQYMLDASSVPTTLTVAAPGYISQTIGCDMTSGSTVTVPDVELSLITGVVVNVNLTYTPAHAEGEAAEIQNWYSDYNNVDYEVYNKTTNQAITNISVQYPQIVLMEDVNDGDVLELTATSRKDAFMPVKTTVTIADQKATAIFNIKELGKVVASYNKNTNPEVTGTLYDADDKLVKTADYKGSNLLLEDLADGSYKLVTMGKSEFFNSIYDLDQLSAVGLQAGTDYVENSVNVKSGLISSVTIDEVPFFDESKLYYTGEQTSFTVNKPKIVIGNYLTFRAQVDFKEQYANKVSNVQLIVDLPDSCQFYENSVLVGTSAGVYTLNGNRITIPLAHYDDIVRFSAIPTVTGDFAPSAFVQFRLNGKTITQPIGNAPFKADGLSIRVQKTVAKTEIPVLGTAIGVCEVDIFDNDVLIGHTTSLQNGTWSTQCELYNPYNLSTHRIHALVTTAQGLILQTETANCFYDKNAIEVVNVVMLYDNPEMGLYNIMFDFMNGTVSPSSYYFFPYKSWPNWRGSGTEPKEFTFVVNFTNNDTAIVSDVIVNVFTDHNNISRLPAVYDKNSDRWVASASFSEGNLPVNVSVDFSANTEQMFTSSHLDNVISDAQSEYNEYVQGRDEIDDIMASAWAAIEDAGDNDIDAPITPPTVPITPPVRPIHDPSGFVYEGVPSNRLQGVTATCYYKETVEDMYGDQHEEVVLWDAEQYGQENPLLTDENGYYRWDVPIGMWQVKYEKAGYETTYSDWLPVPPPQLDVNIGMVQMRQPEVMKAHAYPKAVELEFDKFMIPETLTTDNISVMVNGSAVSGTIELLNAEKDDPLAITSIRRAPGTGLTFASRVRFNADQPFNAEHVTLHVNREVESYAGLEMNDDYEVVLDIELEMQEIVADSVVVVPYLDSKQVTVAVLPPAASAGKVINVVSTSPMIASIDAEQYTLDSNGEAVITVHGDLPGMTSLLYSIDGYDLTASTLIDVKMESELTVARPTASIASGSEVEKGTEVYLYCSTPGATIYYTLDGSCPCDPTPARMMYDGTPIIINSTVTIKAMATAPDLYDSDVATFVYRVRSGLKGDVNNDGEVNIADVNAVIDIILGGVVTSDVIKRGDVNGDGEVNIADINAVIDIILNPASKMSSKVNCDDLLHVNGVTMRPGDVRTLDVTVDHAERYSALQCDIVLPGGLTLVGVNGTNGHESKAGSVDEGTSRTLTYSQSKLPFVGGVPALTITVRADAALAPMSEVVLTNIVLADADNVAWHVADCVAGVNNASGIHDLSVGNHDRVKVEGHVLCIETRQEGVARITAISGIMYEVAVPSGTTRHELAPGIYIVTLNGNSYKIAIK